MSLIGSSGSWLPGIGQNPLPLSGTGYMSCVIIIDSTHLNAGGISQLSLHRNTLTDTLLKDTNYCVETHVRAWNGKVTGFWSCETHDKLGFYFTDQDSLPSPYPWRDGIVPQVWNNTGYIDNLTHWRPVRGKFVASGEEQYMYVGNFAPFSSPPLQHSNSNSPRNTAGRGHILADAFMVYNCRDTVFEINMRDTTVCHGQAVVFHPLIKGVKLEDTVTTYTWHTPSGVIHTKDTFLLATEPGSYAVEVEINRRFTAQQNMVVQWLAPKPDTNLLPENYEKCAGEEVSFSVPEINLATYKWNTGSTKRYIDVIDPGYYSVDIAHPCWHYSTAVLVQDINCDRLFIPNAFTPNNDGVNDFFEIRGFHEQGFQSIALSVFDRWGKRVFYSADYQNDWDGTYNGQPLQTGSYTYLIEYDYIHPKASIPNPKASERQIRGVISILP